MPTKKQELGNWGELLVAKTVNCPKCKRSKTLRQLRQNFKCADLICDFCGYLAQVKTTNCQNPDQPPSTLLGAAWSVQKERLESGIYLPLFIVQFDSTTKRHAIFYLPADLQVPQIFLPREPLGPSAKRAGWQGFKYDFTVIGLDRLIRIV